MSLNNEIPNLVYFHPCHKRQLLNNVFQHAASFTKATPTINIKRFQPHRQQPCKFFFCNQRNCLHTKSLDPSEMIWNNIRGIEWSLRAFASMRAVRLFLRARAAVINFIVRAASTSYFFCQLESLFIETFCAK